MTKHDKELRELEAFRELVTLEPQLERWPRAVPLLERAIGLYAATHQDEKRVAMLKRLEGVQPAHAVVRRWRRRLEQGLQARLTALDESERAALEVARGIVRERGRLSIVLLQRQMGIGYRQAQKFIKILTIEAQD